MAISQALIRRLSKERFEAYRLEGESDELALARHLLEHDAFGGFVSVPPGAGNRFPEQHSSGGVAGDVEPELDFAGRLA